MHFSFAWVDVTEMQKVDPDIGKVHNWLTNRSFPYRPTPSEQKLIRIAESCLVEEEPVWKIVKKTGHGWRLL